MEDSNNNNKNKGLENTSEVRERASIVGMSHSSKYIGVGAITLVTVFILFYIFTSHDGGEQKSREEESSLQDAQQSAEKVVQETQPQIKLPVKLPDLPTLVAPVEAPPPIEVEAPEPTVVQPSRPLPGVDLPQSNVVTQNKNNYHRTPVMPDNRGAKLLQSRNTPMVAMSGGGQSGSGGNSGNINLSDPSSLTDLDNLSKIKDSLQARKSVIDENAPLERTSAEQTKATYIGDLNIIIAQGKIIDAILETAINTDLQGMLRGIVSRDVYSESGRNILLPKGSRLIGEYQSAIADSQVRVNIVWNRVLRPDGIDLQLQSPATDPLGRAGIAGDVDTKFGQMFMNSFLISSVKIAGASLVKKLFPDADKASSTSTTSSGDKTDNTPASVKMATQAVNDLTQTFETLMKRYESNKPTIRVNQGAQIKVYVNKDLVFRRNLGNAVQVEN